MEDDENIFYNDINIILEDAKIFFTEIEKDFCQTELYIYNID